MCGIAGKVWTDPRRPGDRGAVQAMLARIAHRGPDGEGLEVQGPAALGHRRLAVIDLSEAGRQPMTNEDGTLWLSFNGEVYDFQALRARLEARGHRFRSHTDAEVLLHLYEEEGPELVYGLRGMFAFALWDQTRGELLLARDRAGQKPLHYALTEEALVFASEPSALFADPETLRPEPSWEGIAHYVHYGYVPSPGSGFQGVHKLPPGHLLTWRPGGRPQVRRYWKPTFRGHHRSAWPGDRRRLTQELERRLEESVRLRRVADVPLGAFLSGGIDSGLVVATLARTGPEPPRTFTIGFGEGAYDERGGARAVAERYGTAHHERLVNPDAVELLPTLVRHYGEPFADSSALPTWALSAMTREHVTVALSGDGADEVFGGYLRHTANQAGRVYERIPAPLRRTLGELVERLPHRPRPHDPLRYAKRFLRAFERDLAGRNACWNAVIKPETAALVLNEGFKERMAGFDPTDAYRRHFAEADATCDDERVLWADFALYQPDDILVKVDVASMAHGLEVRAPFLDHPLVEWALRLPLEEKFRWTARKRILRRLAKKRLGRAAAKGPKRGFAVPLDAWFRGPLAALFRELVLSPQSRVAAVFDLPALEQLLAQHEQRRWDWHHELWAVLWLEVWWREVLEG
ncbi:MAG: asparagine synthase (glutamine-hydrolyzing) [Planctomycetota bacterium]